MKILIKIVFSFAPVLFFVLFTFPSFPHFTNQALTNQFNFILYAFLLVMYVLSYIFITCLFNKKYLGFLISFLFFIVLFFFGFKTAGCNSLVGGGTCKPVIYIPGFNGYENANYGKNLYDDHQMYGDYQNLIKN